VVKFEALLPLSALILTACTSSIPNETVVLKVWGPQQEQNFLFNATSRYQQSFPQYNVEFEIASVSEVELKGFLTLDIPGGADVFSFLDDQLPGLVRAGALAKVQQFKEDVTNRNVAWTVDVSSFEDELYAYPYTADNGIYMFYDKRYISESEMGSLDTILAKAKSLETKVNIDQMGGWGMTMWFIPENTLSWDGDTQVITWNSENGIQAAEAMLSYYASNLIIDSNQLIPTLFLENNAGKIENGIIAAVSGYWQAPDIERILGDNMGTIKMPTYQNPDGEVHQFGSMVGARLVGVNSFSQRPEKAHHFANWLTSEVNQTIKAKDLKIAPSNLASLQDPLIQSIGPIQALASQGEFGLPQAKAVSSYFWIPADAFAKAIITEAKSIEQKVQAALTKAIQDQLIDGSNVNAVNLFRTEEKQRQLSISFDKIPGWLATLETSVKAVN
jgi:arabinogalactan oligomer / maltooligosaccharide transport system substrate-binding protein